MKCGFLGLDHCQQLLAFKCRFINISFTPFTLPAGTDSTSSSPKIADFGLSALVAHTRHLSGDEEEAVLLAAASQGPLMQVSGGEEEE